MTLRERYAVGLEAMGWGRDYDAQSSKYWVFYIVRAGKTPSKVYLGKSGAIRMGRTIATSRPLSHAIKTKVLNRADRAVPII